MSSKELDEVKARLAVVEEGLSIANQALQMTTNVLGKYAELLAACHVRDEALETELKNLREDFEREVVND